MAAKANSYRAVSGRRRSLVQLAVSVVVLLAAAAVPAAYASMNKTRFMERDGQLIVVSQDVGNQAIPAQWVEGDARRHAENGLTLYYRIDLTELPVGVSAAETEAAIESAVATFNRISCGKNLRLVRSETDPNADLGFLQHQVGLGGEDEPVADITFAGWVPNEFFDATGLSPGFAGALPTVWNDTGSLVSGLDALDPSGPFTDVNGDRKSDVFSFEIYFNEEGTFVVDDDGSGGTLGLIDIETVALHELGHALGMDHFGRTKIILDENGDLVDLVINENSATLMNTNNYFVKREVSGSDQASFCGIYANWGKGRATEG